MDINDIDYDAYLANDRTLADPEVFRVEAGGTVRLRLINGATATAFWIDTGELRGEAIAVDGRLRDPSAAITKCQGRVLVSLTGVPPCERVEVLLQRAVIGRSCRLGRKCLQLPVGRLRRAFAGLETSSMAWNR